MMIRHKLLLPYHDRKAYGRNVYGRNVIVLTLVTILSACTGDANLADLRGYVEEVQKRPIGKIEPIPEFRPFKPFTYAAMNLRSPFKPPVVVVEMEVKPENNLKPITNRPKERLENFDFELLTMVGTIGSEGELWALILDGDGQINRVTNGNYLGKNHGKIIKTSEKRIDILEIVPSGEEGGWVPRPRSLKIEQ